MMRFLMIMIAVALLPAALAAQPAAGSIELPALGLFDFTEGTVEAWVQFEFDSRGWEQEKGIYQWRGRWFTFEAPVNDTDLGAEVVIEYGLKNHGRLGRIEPGCNWRTAFVVDGQKVPHPLLPACTTLEPGTWHHFAITWHDGRIVRAYIDGELAQEMEFPYSIRRSVPSAARIVIGHPLNVGHNLVAIDDLRVSSVARAPEDLGFHQAPLQADPQTLLLLDFETISEQDGQRMVTPAVMARGDAPASFVMPGGRIIEGKAGQGFAFTTAADAETGEQ